MADTNSSGNETSIKQMFQSMIPQDIELMQGTVIQTGPLKIQMEGDDKLIINERITVVPWHLTDYKTTITGHNNQNYYYTGKDTDSGTAPVVPPHIHAIGKTIITVHNALRKGDKLHILSLNAGKLYYVLDRVAGQELT